MTKALFVIPTVRTELNSLLAQRHELCTGLQYLWDICWYLIPACVLHTQSEVASSQENLRLQFRREMAIPSNPMARNDITAGSGTLAVVIVNSL